jgi:hypothetical protein
LSSLLFAFLESHSNISIMYILNSIDPQASAHQLRKGIQAEGVQAEGLNETRGLSRTGTVSLLSRSQNLFKEKEPAPLRGLALDTQVGRLKGFRLKAEVFGHPTFSLNP